MKPEQPQSPPLRPEQVNTTTPFPEFLQAFKVNLNNVFHNREDFDKLSINRGLPPYVLRDVMASSPFSTFIQAEQGGRGGQISEGIALIEAASY